MTEPHYRTLGFETLVAATDYYRNLRNFIATSTPLELPIDRVHHKTLLRLALGHPEQDALFQHDTAHFILFDNGRKPVRNANLSFALVDILGNKHHLSMRGCLTSTHGASYVLPDESPMKGLRS